jgi:hypothetical protein
VASIDPSLHDEIITAITGLQKRETQAELNRDLFWLLCSLGWSFDTRPPKVAENPPYDLGINTSLSEIRSQNNRELCRTSTTLGANWHADFARSYPSGL